MVATGGGLEVVAGGWMTVNVSSSGKIMTSDSSGDGAGCAKVVAGGVVFGRVITT